MVVKSLDDNDSSDEKLNGIQKVSYLLGEKCFAFGVVLWPLESKTKISSDCSDQELQFENNSLMICFTLNREESVYCMFIKCVSS